jgi:transposase
MARDRSHRHAARLPQPGADGARRSDLTKIIWHDGQGACLFSKRLDRKRFLWPAMADGVVTVSVAQLSYLLSGIDWRMPQEIWRPQVAG